MTPLLLRLAILVAAFVTVFLLSQLVLAQALDRSAEFGAVNRRMALLRSGHDRDAVSAALLKNTPPVLGPDASIWRRAYVGVVRMIMTSQIKASVHTVLTAMGLATLLIFILILVSALSAKFSLTLGVVQIVVVMAALMGIGIPLMILSRLGQRRLKRMQEQFPNALDIFIRSLRAGHPVASAIDLITQEMQDPVGSEFGLVSDEISYGASLNDALHGMAERWDMEDLRMFAVCVTVQSETGGNLAEILENLAGVIRDRASMYMKVRALSSEGRMTGWMLTVLPVLAFVALFTFNPAFYLDVAQDRIFQIGFPALMLLYGVGVVSIRRIVDLKV